MELNEFLRLNAARSKVWHANTQPWTASDWATAFAGEAGEVCDGVKKLRRIECGLPNKANDPQTREEAIKDIGLELADTICYAGLLADHLGIDLVAALREKFNAVSEARGLEFKL